MADLGFGQFFQPLIQKAAAFDELATDPRAQAALLSFGAQAAQPRQWGQSDFGHLMSSVAQGGAGVRQEDEATRKEEELAIKRQESDSKTALRESNALLAETRAANAGTNAANAEGRLALRERELEQRGQLQTLQRQIQAQRLYQDYVRRVTKENENLRLMRPRDPQQPVQSFQEWIAANPVMMQNLGLTPESFQAPVPGQSTPPPGSPDSGTTPAPSPQPQPAQSQGQPPPAATRPDGYVWNSPRGRVRWSAQQQRWFPVDNPRVP